MIDDQITQDVSEFVDEHIVEVAKACLKECLDNQKACNVYELSFVKQRESWWYNPWAYRTTSESLSRMSRQEILDDILDRIKFPMFRTKFLCGKTMWYSQFNDVACEWIIRPGTITKLENYYVGVSYMCPLVFVVLSDRFDFGYIDFIESIWNIPIEEEFNVRDLGFDVWKRTMYSELMVPTKPRGSWRYIRLKDPKGIYFDKYPAMVHD